MTKPTKLPQDWKPSDFDIEYAKERGFTDDEIDDIAEDFATYWTLGMGRNKTHLCWSNSGRSAWGTWVRRTRLKSKPADEPYVNGVDPEEAASMQRRTRLTEIVNRRKMEIARGWKMDLTDEQRLEADSYLERRASRKETG